MFLLLLFFWHLRLAFAFRWFSDTFVNSLQLLASYHQDDRSHLSSKPSFIMLLLILRPSWVLHFCLKYLHTIPSALINRLASFHHRRLLSVMLKSDIKDDALYASFSLSLYTENVLQMSCKQRMSWEWIIFIADTTFLWLYWRRLSIIMPPRAQCARRYGRIAGLGPATTHIVLHILMTPAMMLYWACPVKLTTQSASASFH